jgi:hypothetical protein
MSQRTIQITTPQRSGKQALDEFLPERLFDLGVRGDGERDRSIMELLSPNDVRLDPIEHVDHPATVTAPSVPLWPMLAAGLVALGVSLLVLTMFAKYLTRSSELPQSGRSGSLRSESARFRPF